MSTPWKNWFIVVGGIVVSVFALIGSCLKPRSFAGLFGAAPSAALATIGLTVTAQGKACAATEARSLIIGAVAFFVYASSVSRLLVHHQLPALPVSALSMVVWLSVAGGLWYTWWR